MPGKKVQTPLKEKFRNHLLALGVNGAVGTSPLWTSKIPVLSGILNAFPADLQDVILWAALLMAVVGVAVQFFGIDASLSRQRLRPAFIVTLILLVLSVFGTFFQYNKTVIRIQVTGAKTKVAYLVGSNFLPTCPCAKKGLQIRECIGLEISVNPEEVAACYPLHEITTRSNILSGLYLFMTLPLGCLVGLLVLRESIAEAENKDAENKDEPAP